MPETVRLQGVQFAAVRERDAARHIADAAAAGRGGWVVTPNLDILRQCVARPELREMVGHADLVVADGMPLLWAARLQNTRLPERVAGASLVGTLCAEAAARGLSVFLLGGNEGTAEAAGRALCERHPGLRVAGTYCPAPGFERDATELHRIEDSVLRARPAIVFVGLGFPKQEKLIVRLRTVHPAAWWLGVGVTFSFIAGEIPRAPGWMQRSGLEWLHRLAQEPRRLSRRYLVDDPPFALRLMAGALLARIGAGRAGRG